MEQNKKGLTDVMQKSFQIIKLELKHWKGQWYITAANNELAALIGCWHCFIPGGSNYFYCT
jgi:hypothetical protein